jgi:hypothetical protein
MAMVNILFEKAPPVPKSLKKRRASSQTDLSTQEKAPPIPKSPKKHRSPSQTDQSTEEKAPPVPKSPKKHRSSSQIDQSTEEKAPPVPKSPKKHRSSSQTDLSTEEKDATPTKKTKGLEKKSETKTQTKKSVIESPKDKKERDKKMILKANSLSLKKKMLKFNSNKKLEKAKKVIRTKCDNEKSSPDPSKPKKRRKDTKKAARTHEMVIPKRKRCCSGSMCATCFQPLSCQHQSALYWNNQEMPPRGENIPRTNSSSNPEDVKPCINMDMSSSGYSMSRLQHIDNASYVNTMVQHPAMSSHRCPQCAQAAGLLSGCQTYALGGVGSLSSMNLSAVMPYPPAYGGSYTLPYPGTSTLPHCSKF